GLALLPPNHERRPVYENILARLQRRAALAARLPGVLKGDDRPKDAAERCEFATVCLFRRQTLASLRLYEEAFAEEPKLLTDPDATHRYNAACAAALAGVGRGQDAGALPDVERCRLRHKARDWLRADL